MSGRFFSRPIKKVVGRDNLAGQAGGLNNGGGGDFVHLLRIMCRDFQLFSVEGSLRRSLIS